MHSQIATAAADVNSACVDGIDGPPVSTSRKSSGGRGRSIQTLSVDETASAVTIATTAARPRRQRRARTM
jgi:hypothetical protein